MKSEATKFVRLRSFFSTSSKNSSVSLTIETLSTSSNSGYRIWLGTREVDVAQAEPLADEVLGEGRRLGVVEHPLDLRAKRLRLAQLALFGEGEQFLVGHRAPQEIRQPAGQGEVVELAGLLLEEQELRRHQRPP